MKPISWSEFPLPLIQVNPPSLEETTSFVNRAYANGIYSNSGELHSLASNTLAKHINSEFEGYLASNNTMALVACLISIGVRGRHVVISNFTFAATLDAVILAGGIPVVCDIEGKNLTISLDQVQICLDSEQYDIAAVLPTRVLGFVTDFSDLIDLCDNHAVPVVVDAAACFPSVPNSWNFRSQAKFEVFSLHATKVFGIGEGGFVVGTQPNIAEVSSRSNFGLSKTSQNFSDGLNAKADEFTAARALARFPKYAEDVKLRRQFVEIYRNFFSGSTEIQVIPENEFTIYSYFPVIFRSEALMLKFREFIKNYLITRRYYFPTIKSGYIGDAKVEFVGGLEISEKISRSILCLPVYYSFEHDVPPQLTRILRESESLLS